MSKKKKVLRVFEGFAGYGGGSFALRRIKEEHPEFDYEVVGYSELDKYACELYDLNHKDKKGNPIKNFGDITLIDPNSPDFPDFDMFTRRLSLPAIFKCRHAEGGERSLWERNIVSTYNEDL